MSATVDLVNADGSRANPATASDLKSRLSFGLFLLVGFGLGILFQNDIADWLLKWAINKGGDCSDSQCVANQSAYRVSFALFLFFFIHYIMSHSCNCCLEPEQRVAFNRPHTIIRAIAFAVLFFITFVIPNAFFSWYAWFALVVSCFYLIGQLVLLLHFAYTWNENWRNRDEDKFTYGLLAATAILFLGGLVVLGFLFKWFGDDASCSTGQGILSSTVILMVIYTALAMKVPHGSLLPSSVVFAYTVWLAYSGLSSGNPPGVCNTIQSSGTVQMIIGAVVSGFALVLAATNAGQSSDAFELGSREDEDGAPSAQEAAANSFQFFHLMMMMGSCYLAMLLTSWAITGSEGIGINTDSGKASMWVKLSSELLCIALYMWTLAAPVLFPDRNFG